MWIPNTHLSQPALLPRVLKFPPFYFGGIWVLALCRLALTLLTRHGDARAAKTNMRGKIFLYPEGRVVRLGCCRNSHKLMWRRGDNLLQPLLGISLTWCVDVTQSLTFPSIPPPKSSGKLRNANLAWYVIMCLLLIRDVRRTDDLAKCACNRSQIFCNLLLVIIFCFYSFLLYAGLGRLPSVLAFVFSFRRFLSVIFFNKCSSVCSLTFAIVIFLSFLLHHHHQYQIIPQKEF